MNAYMRLFIIALSLVGTTQAIKIKIENRLIDNLKMVYLIPNEFVSQTVPFGRSITIENKSSTMWGPIKFTYNNVTYHLSHTANGWKFQLLDPQTNKPLSCDYSTPYITLHDAELVGFVVSPHPQGGAEIGLNTSVSGKTLQHIDQKLEGLKQSLHEIFPEQSTGNH